MRDKELYRRILGIEAPWEVSEIELDIKGGRGQGACGAKAGSQAEMPSMWDCLSRLRPASAAVAALGHLPAQDAPGGGAAPGAVRGTWRRVGTGAVGGAGFGI